MKETNSIFKAPNKKLYNEAIEHMFKQYSLSELDNIQINMRPFFRKYEEEMKKVPEIAAVFIERHSFMNKTNKSHISAFVSLILSEPNNLLIYIDSLEKPYAEMLFYVALHGIVCANELKDKFEREIMEEKGRYYYREGILNSNLFWCDSYRTYRGFELEYYVKMNSFVRSFFLKAFLLKNKDMQSALCLSELPSGVPYEIMDDEEDFLIRYELFSSMRLQGFISTGINDKLSVSDLKRLAKTLNIKEFYPETPLKEWTHVHAWLSIAPLLYCVPKSCKSAVDALRTTFVNGGLSDAHTRLMPLLLPHIKGMKSNVVLSSNYIEAILDIVHNVYDVSDENEWIDLNILYYKLLSDSHLIMPFSMSAIFNMNMKCAGEALSLDMIETFINRPFYKMVFVLLASLGMVQIAYKRPQGKDVISFKAMFDSFQFVRLTDFGRYPILFLNWTVKTSSFGLHKWTIPSNPCLQIWRNPSEMADIKFHISVS